MFLPSINLLTALEQKGPAETFLESLGNTSAMIKAYCMAAGVRGRRMKSNACVLAVLLRRKFPHEDIRVGDCRIVVGFESFLHSAAVEKFVLNFDRGLYPELEA